MNVEKLKNLMIGAATDVEIRSQDELEYTQLRQTLFREEKFKRLTPEFVKTCGNLKEFRKEMQTFSKQYSERRTHIRNSFDPLISSFFETETIIDPIAEIVQQLDFVTLNLLPQDIQERGKQMSSVYLYLYCIENSLRIFIMKVMENNTVNIPKKVQATIDKMKKSESENKYLPIRGDNVLFYCDFIQLGDIIINNWGVFGQHFPNENEHWLKVMIAEVYKIRCLVAHNSFVGDHERDSLKVYYRTITLQLKL